MMACEVHVRPVAYEVSVWPEDAFDDPARAMNASEWCVTVARVTGFEGIRWAIYRGSAGSGVCLGRDGRWAHEPIPSSRTKTWLRQHRFASLEDAIERAKQAAPAVEINGYTALELANHRRRSGALPPRNDGLKWTQSAGLSPTSIS